MYTLANSLTIINTCPYTPFLLKSSFSIRAVLLLPFIPLPNLFLRTTYGRRFSTDISPTLRPRSWISIHFDRFLIYEFYVHALVGSALHPANENQLFTVRYVFDVRCTCYGRTYCLDMCGCPYKWRLCRICSRLKHVQQNIEMAEESAVEVHWF
jgi:hypothetical protein